MKITSVCAWCSPVVTDPEASHGICPDCLARELATLDADLLARKAPVVDVVPKVPDRETPTGEGRY